MLDKIRKFVEIADLAIKIRDSNMQWKTKFDLIFSDGIRGAISDTEIYFEWCDPDTTYEDDVRAYVDAVEKMANELRELLE